MAAFHEREEDVAVIVRNDFGETEEVQVSIFFRGEDAFEEWESIALRQCGRRVLDLGAGVGAHALVLQAREHEVTALEIIPEAVRIMRERGVKDAREGTLFDLPRGQTFDTAILLMNGSMIAETLSGFDRLLDAVAGVLEPSGALILDSTDLRNAAYAESERDLEAESEGESQMESENTSQNEFGTERDIRPENDGRYFGELHYQLSVGDQMGEVFPQLFVDPETLKDRAELAGWDVEVIWSGGDGRYLARLQRAGEAVGRS